MKKYVEPTLRIVDLETETGILTGSDVLNANNKEVTGEGDGIGDQFSQKDGQNLWGDEGVWK